MSPFSYGCLDQKYDNCRKSIFAEFLRNFLNNFLGLFLVKFFEESFREFFRKVLKKIFEPQTGVFRRIL